MKPLPALPAAQPPDDPGPRPSLSGRAYESLRMRLRRGLVPPDARLVDTEIAAELGVSRMPVREALLQLVSEGYLVSTPRGYRLPMLSAQDFSDIFEVRRLLEPRAAALAARDLTATGRKALDAALAQAEQALARGDQPALFHAQFDFREAWLGAVRNQRLKSLIVRFNDHVQAVRMATLRDAAVQRISVERLRELHATLVQRDPIAAADSMLRFVTAAEQAYAQLFAADATVGGLVHAPGAVPLASARRSARRAALSPAPARRRRTSMPVNLEC